MIVQKEIQKGFQPFLAVVMVLLLIYPGVLAARSKKHGARIIITQSDGQPIEGELLKIKDTELILLTNSESGLTIPVKKIKTIELKKRGKFLTGFAIGVGVSLLAGGIFGSKYDEDVGLLNGVVFIGGFLAIPTGLVSGVFSALLVRYKTYNFENAVPARISKILDKLKSKSRF